MSVLTGKQEYFKGIGKIPFEGKESKNYLAFKYYNPSTKVMGKTMAEHFKFAISYWHSFRGDGGDPFGSATKIYPWDTGDSALIRGRNRADAAFEFFTKLGVDYFCFHDVDMLEEDGADLTTYRKRIDEITDWRKLCVLGRKRRIYVSTQYQYEARTRPHGPIPPYG